MDYFSKSIHLCSSEERMFIGLRKWWENFHFRVEYPFKSVLCGFIQVQSYYVCHVSLCSYPCQAWTQIGCHSVPFSNFCRTEEIQVIYCSCLHF